MKCSQHADPLDVSGIHTGYRLKSIANQITHEHRLRILTNIFSPIGYRTSAILVVRVQIIMHYNDVILTTQTLLHRTFTK